MRHRRSYDAPGLKVSIGRLGTSADTQAISFSADVRALARQERNRRAGRHADQP